jgi:phasin family protein
MESEMNILSQDAALQAWKRQLDTGFRIVEALTEGAERLRGAQLEAVTAAHADAIATQRAVAAANDAAGILRLQAEWARSNAALAMAFWRHVGENTMQTGVQLAKSFIPSGDMPGKQAVARPAAEEMR